VILCKISPDDPATGTDVAALTRVAALKRKIEAGANFEDLASEYSQDQSSNARRGDIGIVFEGSAYDVRGVEAPCN
jgi:parvulin-like peptidyl-prolyl isomerase